MTQGTGGPISNACPECRGNAVDKDEILRAIRSLAFSEVTLTGFWTICNTWKGYHGWKQKGVVLVECECGACGNRWWTNHSSAVVQLEGLKPATVKIEHLSMRSRQREAGVRRKEEKKERSKRRYEAGYKYLSRVRREVRREINGRANRSR